MHKVYMKHNNDCMTACLATLLKLKHEEVPRFFDDNDELLGDWSKMVSDFLESKGYQMITITNAKETLPHIKGLCLVWGKSYTQHYADAGHNHIVVYKDGQLYHDPKPNPDGVIEPEGIDLIFPIFRG